MPFGAVFDNPELIVACVVGDVKAETGPLATAWQSNKFLDPITDGAVLPIPATSMATRSATNRPGRIEQEGIGAISTRLRLTPYLWKVMRRKRCMNSWPVLWKRP